MSIDSIPVILNFGFFDNDINKFITPLAAFVLDKTLFVGAVVNAMYILPSLLMALFIDSAIA